ncbi:hypothetical protein ADICYQ_0841 [Cyclobacterium qasimii M12-11B]|uniref:Uncharacterized protein n=1 Tax=Cyclobacterium qasimii M12-11B TaxID=641524 RepID=S7VKZ0_9BACT|nr:hypothetical protein ADICYQ_0841 [Cyclobacterium qasimii M12-11B]
MGLLSSLVIHKILGRGNSSADLAHPKNNTSKREYKVGFILGFDNY